MMTLLLASILFFLKKQYLLAGLTLGLSVGVKFVPLAILPWMILEGCRSTRWTTRIRVATSLVIMTLAPLIIAYIPLWRGAQTWQALQSRAEVGLTEQELAREEGVRQWLVERGASPIALSVAMPIYRHWPVLLLYVGLSCWLVLRPAPGHWLDAWAILALGFNAWSVGLWFPWYLIWPWMPALVRWDKPRVYVSFACFCAAFGLWWRYVVLKL